MVFGVQSLGGVWGNARSLRELDLLRRTRSGCMLHVVGCGVQKVLGGVWEIRVGVGMQGACESWIWLREPGWDAEYRVWCSRF